MLIVAHSIGIPFHHHACGHYGYLDWSLGRSHSITTSLVGSVSVADP